MLVAFSDCASGRAALAAGKEIARHNHGCLVLVLVLQRPWFAGLAPALTIMPPSGEFDEAEAIRVFRHEIDALPDDLSVVSVVCHGPVGRVLEHVAVEHNCDAIVIGGRSSRRRPWPGSLERYLRHRGYAPVMVVHGPEATAPECSPGEAAVKSPSGSISQRTLVPWSMSASKAVGPNPYLNSTDPPEVSR